MEKNYIITQAKKSIETEISGLLEVKNQLNEYFALAVIAIQQSKGRLIVTGIGKSGNIAQKLVATFNSTGTPAIFMHAADALHGDLGSVQQNDIVLCISNSGNSPEIKILIPFIKNRNNLLIAITGNSESYLAQSADFVINSKISKEACLNNLAPTTSTTAQMALGDALAVCLMELNQFSLADFAKSHPGGALGKKLFLTVATICAQKDKPSLQLTDGLDVVIDEISKKRQGAAVVLNGQNICGIITDGDIRRMLQKSLNLQGVTAQQIMSAKPKTILLETLASEALKIMQEKSITQLVVTDAMQNYHGIIHIHDLLKEGLDTV